MDAKEKRKQYYLNNREKILEKSMQYYHDNKEERQNIIMSIGLYMDIYTCKKEV